MNVLLHNGLNKGSRDNNYFSYIIFFWFFITIFPQLLFVTRFDSFGNILKSGLYILFVAIVILTSALKRKTRFNIKELILGLYLFIIYIITNYFINPSSLNILMNISVITLNYIIFMSLFNDMNMSKNHVSLFAFLYEIFILYACIYNIIKYGTMFAQIFKISFAYQFMFQSFFTNRNTFALFLYIGVIIIMLKIRIDKKTTLFDRIVLLLVLMNLFLTLSRTSIFGTVIYFIVYCSLCNIKKMISYSFKIITLIILTLSVLYLSNGFEFIVNIIVRPERGLSGRDEIWSYLIERYINGNVIFGQGLGILNDVFTHNTFLSLLVTGGIALCIFYFIFYLRTYLIIKKIITFDRYIGFSFLSALVSFILVTMVESGIPFYSSAKDTIFTIVIFLLPKYYLNYIKNSEQYNAVQKFSN